MGSRYGGLKQIDNLGPNGETIMDYSVYDAKRAGFGKIFFVIRHSFEKEFRERFLDKFDDSVEVGVLFQELDSLPQGFSADPTREKPFGTNHAVLMAKDAIKEPFAIINADDFYERKSFEVMAEYLQTLDGKKNQYCMVGYEVGNTLSENGTVNRGVCATDEDRMLVSIEERYHIERVGSKVQYKDEQDAEVELDEKTPVSMNFWGFTPDYFDYSDAAFRKFLKDNDGNIKAEFGIPTMVNELIQSNTVKIKVLSTPSKWFGVTYSDDRPQVVMKINSLVRDGVYPQKLWQQ
jgi:choline kinase